MSDSGWGRGPVIDISSGRPGFKLPDFRAPARRPAAHRAHRARGAHPAADRLLPDRDPTRWASCSASGLRPRGGAGPALQDPVRGRDASPRCRCSGSSRWSSASARCAPGPASEFAPPAPGDDRRVRDADRRPERRRRRVDRAVPDQGSAQSTCSTCATPQGTFRRHVRGRHAPGRGRPQRGRGADHRPRGRSPCRPRIELQRLCDLYGIGIEVQQLVLQDVNPPDPVKPAFNEVNQAIQEKERAINEAWADYNKSVPRREGRGRAGGALGRRLRRWSASTTPRATPTRFDALYEEYRKAPAVTREAHLPGDAARSSCRSSAASSCSTSKAQRRACRSSARAAGEGGEAVRRPALAASPRRGCADPAPRLRLHGVGDRAGHPHPVRQARGRPRHRPGPAHEGALHPGRAPLRQALAGVRRRSPTRSRPRTRSTSGWTPTRAGASPTRCASTRR